MRTGVITPQAMFTPRQAANGGSSALVGKVPVFAQAFRRHSTDISPAFRRMRVATARPHHAHHGMRPRDPRQVLASTASLWLTKPLSPGAPHMAFRRHSTAIPPAFRRMRVATARPHRAHHGMRPRDPPQVPTSLPTSSCRPTTPTRHSSHGIPTRIPPAFQRTHATDHPPDPIVRAPQVERAALPGVRCYDHAANMTVRHALPSCGTEHAPGQIAAET